MVLEIFITIGKRMIRGVHQLEDRGTVGKRGIILIGMELIDTTVVTVINKGRVDGIRQNISMITIYDRTESE